MNSRIFFISLTFLFSFYCQAQLNTDFKADPRVVCVGEPVQFTDLTTPSGSTVSWDWNFGDGNESTDQNPSHTYAIPGSYKVTLVASDGTTSKSEVKNNYITVNPLPSPSFDADPIISCSVPAEVSFSNIQPSSGVSYDWDFDNGQTSTSGTPGDETYSSVGSYDITLKVTDESTGCTNDTTQSVEFFDYTADFSLSSSTVCVGEEVNFTDESPAGTDGWSWSFDDGNSSSDENPDHSFASSGTYTVTLDVTNSSNGCSATYTEDVEVLELPVPSFTNSPESGCAPLDVTFTNTSTGNGTFEWDFGNTETYSGEDPPVQTYSSDGSYTVTLTQTDDNGCSNSVVVPGAVSVAPIVADFEADTMSGCEDLDVQFTDLSNSPNSDDPITSWEWNFGDGSPVDNNQNPPLHTYSEGVYYVTLTVTTDEGCTDVKQDSILVGVPPDANFSLNPTRDCAKSEFDFTNLTTIPVPFDSSELVFKWDFGKDRDQGTSSEVSPTYEYPLDTGYFDVELIVLFRGCPDTVLYEDTVYVDAPIANFSTQKVYCNPTLPLDVEFKDTAIIGRETDDAEMKWEWGDGDIETITPPDLYNDNPGQVTHQYDNFGTYTIKQVVYNNTTGCADSVERTIHISETVALFDYSNDSTCVNSQVSLTNNGSSSSHPITSYTYNFNDGSSSLSGQDVDYTYTTPGTYDIEFIVLNNVGCADTAVFNDFEVLALPEAVIDPSADAGCSPLTVIFSSADSDDQSGVPLSSFKWTFEDGTNQTTTTIGETTNYTFTGEGTFQTSLVVTDEFGCESPSNTVDTDITKPTADFDVDTAVCNLQEFTATNTSVGVSSSEWFLNSTLVSTDTDYTTSLSHEGSETELSFTDEIELVVTDVNGCKDALTQDIVVSTPFADFDYVFDGANVNAAGEFVCPPVFADLTDESGTYGSVSSWNWDFGDGSNSILQNPSNTYVFAGTYTASLVIIDDVGCSDTVVYEDYLTIGGPSGNLDWTNIGNLCDPEITFTPSELDGVTDILWALGNGDTLNSLEEFNYSYEGGGTYSPTAILINEDGCNVPYYLDPITIEINTLDAYFEVSPSTVNLSDPMTINDLSSGGFGGIVDWFWDIDGDQFYNNGGTYDYLFNTTGEVNISLVITDSLGCQDTFEIDVNVTDKLTIPNVLTPNGDDSNDEFELIDNVFKEYTVTILNRWGNVVSETFVEEDNYLWNGRNKKGEKCTEGVYFYRIIGIQRDGKEREEHGFVHLIIDDE